MGQDNGKKIAFLTLGCKLNYAETSTWERGFVRAGLQVVPWSAAADIYLVNTCSVTAMADAKSRNLVRKVLRVNPSALVIVTGCSAQLRRGDYESIPGVARVFGCDEKAFVVQDTLALAGITEAVSSFPAKHSEDRESLPSSFPAKCSEDRQGCGALRHLPFMLLVRTQRIP